MAIGDTNEAGCSFQGPACIINMYSGYGDDDGMMDSLRHYTRRHKDYNPAADPELDDTGKAIVSIAMFQVAVQDTPKGASLWDILKATWTSAASTAIFGVINDGINWSHDDDGGGGGFGGSDLKFGGHHSKQQWKNDMAERGWTYQQIREAIQFGESVPTYNSVHPGNPARRYINPETGRSVVVDDITHEILHLGGDNFKYSPRP